MRTWLITFGNCLIAILLALAFVDLPVARFVHTMPWEHALHAPVFGIPLLVGFAGLVLVGFALQRGWGHNIGAWEEALLLMVLSLCWSVSVTEFALKPLFGRHMPFDFLATGKSSFHWFEGAPTDSFPSGHAAQFASVFTVLCMVYPRWRGLWCALIAAGSLVLVLGNWHFVSDVIAGNFVGAFGAAMIVGFWQRRPGPK